jgi:N-terminal domain of toast_rack, DUF2154/Cell wall-active antibiotics response 4TMS YvqF
MHAKRVLVANLLVLLTLLFAATACNEGVRVGDLQTTSQTIELDDADSVSVEIQTGAAELDVSGGASELLEASFTYNVEELNPRATYAGGRLEVTESDVEEGIGSLFDLDEYRNEWDLKLNEDVPMEMRISLNIAGGAGDVHLALGGSQSLSQLDFNMGAGEVTIDLTGEWGNDLDARLNGGLGDINLRLPSDVGVRIEVETGVGGVDAGGLTKDGNTYTNDAFGASNVTLRIHISGGVGQINLDVE